MSRADYFHGEELGRWNLQTLVIVEGLDLRLALTYSKEGARE
jgi:hypothetical protein